jgi:hypothetical protein
MLLALTDHAELVRKFLLLAAPKSPNCRGGEVAVLMRIKGMNPVAHPPLFAECCAVGIGLLPGSDHSHGVYLAGLGEHFPFSFGERFESQGLAKLRQVQGTNFTLVSTNCDR